MPQAQTEQSLKLESFRTELNVAVIGASGGIGGALVADLQKCQAVSKVFRLSRSSLRSENNKDVCLHLDLDNEETIAEAAAAIKRSVGELHLVIVATGILYDSDCLQPEKTWRAVTGSAMETAFRLNTIGPALVAKHFLPLLAKDRKSVFAAISARIGSIKDNHLGGWYAYRASKAALNMVIRTLSIELARSNTNALCVGLHPGTVDTALSKPFQRGVAEANLFPAARSARHLLTVLDNLTPEKSGCLYAWDGSQIPF